MTLFEQTLVINLRRRPDRLKRFLEQACKAQIDALVFEGTDGRLITQCPLPIAWSREDSILSDGMLGCFLSHRAALELSLKNGWESVLILEDDVLIPDDFVTRLDLLQSDTPADWDMIYLGRGHWDANGVFSESRHLTPLRRAGFVVPGIWKSTVSSSAYAYAVHRRCLPYLLSGLAEVRAPVDEQLAALQQRLSVYAYFPFLIRHSDAFPSDITNSRRFNGGRTALEEPGSVSRPASLEWLPSDEA